jgi:hypothetical protein
LVKGRQHFAGFDIRHQFCKQVRRDDLDFAEKVLFLECF